MTKLVRTIVGLAVLPFMLLATGESYATTLRSPSDTVIALWFYQLEGREVPWETWAKSSTAYGSANDFAKPRVLREEIAKLKASFESLKTADMVELYTDSALSSYDADHECYYLDLFSANVFWPYTPSLPGREEFAIQLDNPKEFYEWKIAAARAEKLFPNGGNVKADIIMKIFRTDPGGMGMGGRSVLVAHAVSVDLIYNGAKVDTLKEKSRTPGAVVAAQRAEEPALYDVRGLKVGQTIKEVVAAATKEGMKLGIIDNKGVPLNAPPLNVPATAKELVFYTGTLAPPVGLRWQTKAEGATIENNLVVSGGDPEDDFHIVGQGSTRTTVRIADEPVGPVKAGQVCQIRYEQMFPYVESFEAKEFVKGLQEDLLANYGKPTTRKGDMDGFGWTYGEKGESLLDSRGYEEVPFEALLTAYESGSANKRSMRRTQNMKREIAGFLVSIRAQPVKPKVAATPPPAPTRLFGKPLTAPPTEIAPPEETPVPTPKPRLFGSSGSQPRPATSTTAEAPATVSAVQTTREPITPPTASANDSATDAATLTASDTAPPAATGEANRQRPEQATTFSAPEAYPKAGTARKVTPPVTIKAEAIAADKELNAAYQPLLTRLRRAGPDVANQLIASQKGWLAVRDRITDPTEQIAFVRARANDFRQRSQFIDQKMKEYDDAHPK